ncbi:FAD-dependent oxidoreductase [Blautia liquoris]|uniref:NADH oxidase n=1 Tax=Blautia liquoris TaxID=2779518 RepID=A0A7M2RE35_9FIRM|nr:FAD-dependent oxidoreductase [Blautia liquoris]QOV18585.1 FAD-dependent oxidoreductase [Blautia liquoris]
MEKVVVIGANHAGTAALNTILDQYPDKEVIAFDQNSNISFLGCGMALWIGKQISSSDGLFYSDKKTLEEKGAKVYMETEVDHVDFDQKIIYATDKSGEKYEQPYDKLILATGSLPVVPQIEGIHLENVQLVKLFQHAQEVIDKLKDDSIRHVTVIGAGYIGVELAEAFKRNGREVTLIDCADTCLGGYFDPEFTDRMAARLKDNGVHLAFGETVKKLTGDKKVRKVITDKCEYDTDMVVLAIGFCPNNEIGKERLELFRNGAYLVNRSQETSVKDVYAVGDCATVYDNAIQDTNYIALATNAVRSGIIAAHNACGTKLETVGVQGSNAISIWGLHMISTGMTLTKACKNGYDAAATDFEDYQKALFIENGNYKVKIRIVYDKKTRIVLGAQLCSEYDVSMAIHMFSLAIQEQVTIDKLKLLDIFFLPHFNQPYNYITMAALSAD